MVKKREIDPTVEPLGEGKYRVQSFTEPGQSYVVTVQKERGGVCTCPVGQKGKFCKHMRAVYTFMDKEQLKAEAVMVQSELPMEGGPKSPVATPAKDGQSRLTKLGYRVDEAASALQKEIRRGDEEAAVYWALTLAEVAPFYAWKRVLITAAEDVGLAAPETVGIVCGLAQAWHMCKENAWYVSPHHLTMAVMLLCRAPKNTEAEDLQSLTEELIRRGVKRPLLPEYLDAHTKQGKDRKATWREWYEARHGILGLPVNRYTEKLWDVLPEWDPRPKE